VKTRTLIIGTGTVLVLLAPAATAAPGKTVPRQAAGHKIVQKPSAIANRSKQKSSATRAGAGAPVPAEHDVIYVAPFGMTPIFTPHYIYIPAPPTSPQPYVDPNECEDNGTNCTDAQLCEFWGENCGSFPLGISPSEAPAEGTQSGS
jgi:hypothetical protein